jgi:predicted enzyme related to lactoylglutathione lyase
MSRVTHFEVHADDPHRAITFYSAALGWKFDSWGAGEEYWLITTGPDDKPGINGGLHRRRGMIDGTAIISYVSSLNVDSLDETIGKVEANGGTVVVPKMPVPGVGWLAYAKDTEGNVFGMMEVDSSAA